MVDYNINLLRSQMYIIIIFVIIIILIIPLLIVYFYGQHFLFHPGGPILSSPIGSTDIITVNGIHGWVFNRGENTPLIIYSHGNAGNIASKTGIITISQELGISLVLYDYRGFGNSTNFLHKITPTTTSIIEDGMDIYQEITNLYPGRKIILWGESMGSAVATHLASIHPEVIALIIQSGYARLGDVIDDKVGSLLGSIFAAFHKCPDNIEIMNTKNITIPTLILHATDDTLIPFSQAEKIYASLHGYKQLVSTVGGHNFLPITYIEYISIFFNNHVKSNYE